VIADAERKTGDGKRVIAEVMMYATAMCPYCNFAERLLRAKGVAEIAKVRVDL
jgi:glutaredoxin 3